MNKYVDVIKELNVKLDKIIEKSGDAINVDDLTYELLESVGLDEEKVDLDTYNKFLHFVEQYINNMPSLDRDIEKIINSLGKDGSIYKMNVTDIINEVGEGLGYCSETMWDEYGTNEAIETMIDTAQRKLGEYLIKSV